jgi:FixJ family two-component response regulator
VTGSPPVVCVVDDDASVVKGVGRLLRAWSYEVRTCEACQVVELAAREPLDCLVLDVHMPGLSGLDVQAEVARSGTAVPIVLVTGHGDDTARARAISSGAIAFLQKPFTDRQLIAAVELAVARRREAQGGTVS